MELLIEGNRKGVWFYGETKLYTTTYCIELFGFTSKNARATADKKMRRAGIQPFPVRLPGRGGENLWRADQVRGLLN